MKDKLYAHQEKFLGKNPNKSLLCWDTGTGKTRASIEWANKGKGPTLFICPKSLKKNWRRNIDEHYNKEIHHFLVTKEEFRKLWESFAGYHQVVIDEGHYFAGATSLMTKSLTKFLKANNVKRVLILTATPYMSTPWNIFTLAKHLGHIWSWIDFRMRFFTDKYIGRRVIPVVKVGIEAEIAGLVASIGDIVDINECADVPEQIFDKEEFDLTTKQTKAIKENFDANPIVRFTKHHQIENGVLKGDEYVQSAVFDCHKNDRIYDLCQENDKTIVVCRYNQQIDMLQELLSKLGKPILVIRGDVKDRDAVVQEAEKLKQAIVLIQAQCSEGYELPSFPLMVFASLSFSYKDYKQMLGRILRLNKLKKNVYLHLVSKGIDEAVYNAIMKKQDFDIEIYSKQHGVSGEEFPN